MNELTRFEQMAARARDDRPPRIDVAARVLSTLAAPTPRETIDRPMLVSAGLSAVAAAAAIVVAVQSLASVLDPLSGFFSALTMVMQ